MKFWVVDTGRFINVTVELRAPLAVLYAAIYTIVLFSGGSMKFVVVSICWTLQFLVLPWWNPRRQEGLKMLFWELLKWVRLLKRWFNFYFFMQVFLSVKVFMSIVHEVNPSHALFAGFWREAHLTAGTDKHTNVQTDQSHSKLSPPVKTIPFFLYKKTLEFV